MKKIVVEWKHFDKNGATCERCSQTGKNLEQALFGLPVEFIETKLPESRMAESNQILIDGVLLEVLIHGAKAGENSCGSCGDLIGNPGYCHCRTVNQGKEIHESIPISLIKQAINNKLNRERKQMKIQVLGSGCATCKKLYELTQKAVAELNLDAPVEYITDVSQIIAMGVMGSPVLAVDGKPVMVGFLPDITKIKKAITAGVSAQPKPSQCSCGGNC